MNHTARTRIRFFFIFAALSALLFFGWLLFTVLFLSRRENFGTSPVIVSSVLLLLTILSLIVSVRLIFYFRSRLQIKKNSLDGGFSVEEKETDFVAETFQTVVSHLQVERRQLTRLQAETDLRRRAAEQFSRRVISGLPSGLIAFDIAGRLQVINEPARDLIEYEADGADTHFTDVLAKIPELREMVSATLGAKTLFRRETLILNQNAGKTRRLGVTVAPLEAAANAANSGALCLLTDITEISELRAQLALKQNLASLGEMAAGLTHEFKNSLAAIQTLAQFLESLETSERGVSAARSLLGEVRNLSGVVTAFLDFARPQPLQLCSLDLSELIYDCVQESKPLAGKFGVEIKFEGVFPIIQADEQMLRRVFLNLIRNAIEAFAGDSEDSPAIKITGTLVFANPKRQWATIEISDNGKGIADKDLPFLFVPFYTTKADGHGIGLALSHRIVTEHGGSLAAANSEAGGAVFTCKLPSAESGV